MRRLFASLSLLLPLTGCARPVTTPVAPAPAATPAAVTVEKAPSPEAPAPVCSLDEVRKTVAELKLRVYGIEPAAAVAAVEAGLDEDTVACSLEQVYGPCLSEKDCGWPQVPEIDTKLGERLLTLLGEIATDRSLGVLLRLQARGSFRAESALERVLERRMGAAALASPCAPPSDAEVATARAELDASGGFAVIDRRSGKRWTARAATGAELDDLAYFLAAVSEAGPPVGAAAEDGSGGGWARSGPRDEQGDEARDKLHEALKRAQSEGDVEGVQTGARAYLASIGYPDAIHTSKEGTYAWGGARFSYVMRDLALASEIAGESAAAASLYRRANPGGGACGTSVDYRWQEQVEGAIRSAEVAGQCRAVVAERLLDIAGDGARTYDDGIPAVEQYGPQRLAEAGFDVPRLYRGALVTRNRDLPRETLEKALSGAPAKVRDAARARLQAHGVEAWEKRVYAAEGLADTAREGSIAELTALLGGASNPLKVRVLTALGELTSRPQIGPCPDDLSGLSLSGSNVWSRRVRALGPACEDRLDDAAADKLATRLHRHLRDRDVDVRQATAETLGKLASPTSVAALRGRLKDPKVTHYTGDCDSTFENKECVPGHGVRDAAREAIDRIEELKKARDERAASRVRPAPGELLTARGGGA